MYCSLTHSEKYHVYSNSVKEKYVSVWCTSLSFQLAKDMLAGAMSNVYLLHIGSKLAFKLDFIVSKLYRYISHENATLSTGWWQIKCVLLTLKYIYADSAFVVKLEEILKTDCNGVSLHFGEIYDYFSHHLYVMDLFFI